MLHAHIRDRDFDGPIRQSCNPFPAPQCGESLSDGFVETFSGDLDRVGQTLSLFRDFSGLNRSDIVGCCMVNSHVEPGGGESL